MSNSSSKRPPEETFKFPTRTSHWHDQDLTPALGCQSCVFHDVCGGLNVEAGIFDCRTYCRCADKARCDNVCPHNPRHYVSRSREVNGFDFKTVRAAGPVAVPPLPLTVPMLFHSSSLTRSPNAAVVALSLFQMFNAKTGKLRFTTRQQLLAAFRLSDETVIILSGVEEDFHIEKWWKLADREDVIRGLKKLGIAMITTPNYSLFGDVHRLDNLFNMKRIALVWSEIQREGMACALHINARTDRDYERWTEFLRSHPEISHVAFEFGTGAGAQNRIPWHITQLTALARRTPQPLHLIVRGGIARLGPLRRAYAGLTFIDTTSVMKTQYRTRLVLEGDVLKSVQDHREEGEPLDDLLAINMAAMRAIAERNAGIV
jgi:hypothetical protein